MLRVLHVLTSDQRRGAELSAVMLQTEFRRRGHLADAVALASQPGDAALDDVRVLGPRRLAFRALRRLREAAASVDVVLAHGSSSLPACAVALAGPGCPPFVYANIGDPLFWANSWPRRRRVRLLLSRAAAVAAISTGAREVLETQFGVAPDRLMVIPNGRMLEDFPFADRAARRAARARLGLEVDAEVVVVLGALTEEKRVDVALRAWSQMMGTLLVAGDGPERESLKQLASQVAPGRTRFLGQVTDTRTLLAAADALLLTSDSEGAPGVLIEAGLTGLPVVATDVGFVRDIVNDGVTGVVVPPDAPAATRAALRSVLRDRAGMGERARAHCAEKFDMLEVATAWESLLTCVAAKRPR